MTENIIKQPPLPDTIRFNHTLENPKEVMRITRDGVWVNPDMQVDDVAKAVLDALSLQVRVLVQKAVEDERQACMDLCDKIEKEAYQMYRKNYDAYEDGVSAGARACLEEIARRGK